MYSKLEEAGLINGTEEHYHRYLRDSPEEREKALPPVKALQGPDKKVYTFIIGIEERKCQYEMQNL